MKICPKCGQQVQASDQFCPHCGTALATNEAATTTRQSRRQTGQNPKAPKKRWRRWLALAVVVALLLIGGGWWFKHTQNQSVVETASSQSSSTSLSSSSSESTVDESSQKTASSDSSGSTDKLSTNLGSQETATAILFYGGHKYPDSLYKGNLQAAQEKNSLYIYPNKFPTDQKNGYEAHPGQGVAYRLVPSQIDASISYTLDQDQTVNFYQVGKTPLELDYLGSASWQSIINYDNQHNAAPVVRQLGSVAHLSEVSGDE